MGGRQRQATVGGGGHHAACLQLLNADQSGRAQGKIRGHFIGQGGREVNVGDLGFHIWIAHAWHRFMAVFGAQTDGVNRYADRHALVYHIVETAAEHRHSHFEFIAVVLVAEAGMETAEIQLQATVDAVA